MAKKTKESTSVSKECISLCERMGYDYSKLSNTIYEKTYHDGTTIQVDMAAETINYSGRIRMDRKTILNFDHRENLVVLECVDRLLELGYHGENIYLEKDCGDAKDYIDIAIYDRLQPAKIYTIIECKQYGTAYENAVRKAQSEGRQIIRYAVQDKHCHYIILYTSRLKGKTIERTEKTIDLSIYDADNRDELFEFWDKAFLNIKFFQSNAYEGLGKKILRRELKPITTADIGTTTGKNSIYNNIRNILRRHSVSDKDNAYNKIFNLFLCKIVDEDEKLDDEETDFQWGNNEDAETVLVRLNDLYRKGMKDKLNLTIADYSENDLERIIGKGISSEMKKVFTELRLYKNTEFAFKEVFDKRTFYENAFVVKEIVKLLEDKQIKYTTKQQFLGDFFEKLLNIGVKQEAGQFFTPIPIAEFILRSLPVRAIIDRKIEEKQELFLPYTIDYSCGSGHFLTEAMSRIQDVLNECDPQQLSAVQKKNMSNWNDFAWAKEFLYGIEDDYRLAKTTKVACFMNGDGDANIIYANGLDSFNSGNYWGKLRLESDNKENGNFDIVVANPPYSVEDFKTRLQNGAQNFTLFNSTKKDDIECLFVERTGQLLRDGGVAGVILPSTFLTVDSYIHARRYLLKNFRMKGICFLGQQTFAATTKSTCVLFMQKITEDERARLDKCIVKFMKSHEDFAFQGHEHVIADYLQDKHDNQSFESYIGMLRDEPVKAKAEAERIFIWMLNLDKTIPIAVSGNKEQESLFLGYKHTTRKRYEGIMPYPQGAERIDSLLFGENGEADKINYFIVQSFLDNSQLPIPDHLRPHLYYKEMNKTILDDDGYIILTKNRKEIASYLNKKGLGDECICEVCTSGDSAPKKIDINKTGQGIPFIRAAHLNRLDAHHQVIPQEYVTDEAAERNKLTLFKAGSVVFPKSGQSVNTNNIGLLATDSYVVSHLAVLTFKTPTIGKYVYHLLKHYGTANFKLDDSADYPTLRMSVIERFKIPYDESVVQEIADKTDEIDYTAPRETVEEKERALFDELVYVTFEA